MGNTVARAMNTNICPHCGNIHAIKCPLIKAIEYNQDGTIKRLEFYSQNDYKALTTEDYQRYKAAENIARSNW